MFAYLGCEQRRQRRGTTRLVGAREDENGEVRGVSFTRQTKVEGNRGKCMAVVEREDVARVKERQERYRSPLTSPPPPIIFALITYK